MKATDKPQISKKWWTSEKPADVKGASPGRPVPSRPLEAPFPRRANQVLLRACSPLTIEVHVQKKLSHPNRRRRRTRSLLVYLENNLELPTE
jgi:hypothetical protein